MAGDIPGATHLPDEGQEDYLTILCRAVEEVNRPQDFVATLRNVTRALVPHFADWCAVDVADQQGVLQRLAIAHVNPKKAKEALNLAEKYPRDPSADSGSSYVYRTGEPNMRNGITDDMLVAAAINEEHLRMMRGLNFRSMMIVPIKSREKILGTFTFVWSEIGKSYSLTDLTFAGILAALTGNAIDLTRTAR